MIKMHDIDPCIFRPGQIRHHLKKQHKKSIHLFWVNIFIFPVGSLYAIGVFIMQNTMVLKVQKGFRLNFCSRKGNIVRSNTVCYLGAFSMNNGYLTDWPDEQKQLRCYKACKRVYSMNLLRITLFLLYTIKANYLAKTDTKELTQKKCKKIFTLLYPSI